MKTLKLSKDDLPETYHPVQDKDGRRRAFVTCANGHTCSLTDHTIHADGMVEPSLVCPYDGCNWHEHVKLEGWQTQ